MPFKVTKHAPAESKKVLKHHMGHQLAKKTPGPQYAGGTTSYEYGSGQKRGAKCRGPA